MERDYMDVWCNQLSLAHRTVEEETNIRGPDFNTEEVVEKYRAHEELVIQRKKMKAWDTMKKQLEQRTKKKKGKAEKEGRPSWDTLSNAPKALPALPVKELAKRPGVATRYNSELLAMIIMLIEFHCYPGRVKGERPLRQRHRTEKPTTTSQACTTKMFQGIRDPAISLSISGASRPTGRGIGGLRLSAAYRSGLSPRIIFSTENASTSKTSGMLQPTTLILHHIHQLCWFTPGG